MTIEEWLDKQIRDAWKACLETDVETYEGGYYAGYKDALERVRYKLPFLERETTSKEVAAEDCEYMKKALDYFQGCVTWYAPEGKDFYSPGGVRYREEKAKSDTWAQAAQYIRELIRKEGEDE